MGNCHQELEKKELEKKKVNHENEYHSGYLSPSDKFVELPTRFIHLLNSTTFGYIIKVQNDLYFSYYKCGLFSYGEIITYQDIKFVIEKKNNIDIIKLFNSIINLTQIISTTTQTTKLEIYNYELIIYKE